MSADYEFDVALEIQEILHRLKYLESQNKKAMEIFKYLARENNAKSISQHAQHFIEMHTPIG